MNTIIKNNNSNYKNIIRFNSLIINSNNSISGSLKSKRYFANNNLATPFISNKNDNSNSLKKDSSSKSESTPSSSSSSNKIGIGKENFNLIKNISTTNTSSSNSINNRVYDVENFTTGSGNNIGSNGSFNSASDGLKSFKVLEIDINGNPEEKRIYKVDLSSELKLQARDLRTIDPSFPPQMPSILVRDKVILISIGAVRAIIQYNRVMLFETQNMALRDEVLGGIKESVQSNYEYLPLPFEFKAFESILDLVCKKLDFEFRRMQGLIEKELQLLNENPEHNLEELLLYHKKGLNQFEVKIKEIIDAITDLLQSDEDMALMYLSFRHATGGARRKNQHDEIEILLETYTRQLEQMSSNISQLKETLNSTEEFVNFQLDTARNKIMSIQLMLSILTISTGLGGVIAGTFGMNLLSGLEQSSYAFASACGVIGCISIATFVGLRKYCQVKNILPYTKKTPNRLQLGLGFRNDSFINPLRDNILLKEEAQQALKDGQIQHNQTSIQLQLQQMQQHQLQLQYESSFNREFKGANIQFGNSADFNKNSSDNGNLLPRDRIQLKLLRNTQKLNKIEQHRLQQQQQQEQSNQYISQLEKQIQQQNYQIQQLQDLQYQIIAQQQHQELQQLENKKKQQEQKIQFLQQQLQFDYNNNNINNNNNNNTSQDDTNNNDISDDNLTFNHLNQSKPQLQPDPLQSHLQSQPKFNSPKQHQHNFNHPTPILSKFWKLLHEETIKPNQQQQQQQQQQ